MPLGQREGVTERQKQAKIIVAERKARDAKVRKKTTWYTTERGAE